MAPIMILTATLNKSQIVCQSGRFFLRITESTEESGKSYVASAHTGSELLSCFRLLRLRAPLRSQECRAGRAGIEWKKIYLCFIILRAILILLLATWGQWIDTSITFKVNALANSCLQTHRSRHVGNISTHVCVFWLFSSYMLHYVHWLVANFARLIFGDRQVAYSLPAAAGNGVDESRETEPKQ